MIEFKRKVANISKKINITCPKCGIVGGDRGGQIVFDGRKLRCCFTQLKSTRIRRGVVWFFECYECGAKWIKEYGGEEESMLAIGL